MIDENLDLSALKGLGHAMKLVRELKNMPLPTSAVAMLVASPAMAAIYTKAASQKKLAQGSVHLMQKEQPANKLLSHPTVAPLQATENK
jgi:hypothetical protein